MYLFIEKGLRGGEQYMNNYDPTKPSIYVYRTLV